MKPNEMIAWIDTASYAQLLRIWRFDPSDSAWFEGAVGRHLQKVLGQRRQEVGDGGHVHASKTIGW